MQRIEIKPFSTATATAGWAITAPDENDVLCGVNRMFECHSGNKMFRRLVVEHLNAYVGASKNGKTAIISTIIGIIRSRSPNGGFIQKDPLTGFYVPIADHYAVSLNYFHTALLLSLRQTNS
jgi:hypothetical protein